MHLLFVTHFGSMCIYSVYVVTTVHHIWESLDEKDTPRVFNRTEVDILLDDLCT